MKLTINCPRCGSPSVSIAENPNGNTPLYKCERCGYKNSLFPQFGNEKQEEE